jgi:hypothetical protein
MQTSGLRLDQAPPLHLPARFFVTAPVMIGLAGALLIARPSLLSTWLPDAIALTHLGVLGVLSMVMFGALYQMVPVVAGVPVPAVRLAAPAHLLLTAGTLALVGGLALPVPGAVAAGRVMLGVAAALFVFPVGLALLVAPARSDTVTGMRLALLSLALVLTLGVLMAAGHSGGTFPGPRLPWLQLHLCLGLIGWVGGLLTAVALQLVPMFWLSEPLHRTQARAVTAAIGLSVLLLSLAHIAGSINIFAKEAWLDGWLIPLAAAPGAAAVWLVQPVLTLRRLAQRKRARPDGSLRFWQAGLLLAPLSAAAGVLAVLIGAPWSLLWGWLVIWGWAGLLIHGTLNRIVSFLVWFHRYSPLVGSRKVPSMRHLLPEVWVYRALAIHLSSLLLGSLGILLGSPALIRLTGAAVLLTGLVMLRSLVLVLGSRPEV